MRFPKNYLLHVLEGEEDKGKEQVDRKPQITFMQHQVRLVQTLDTVLQLEKMLNHHMVLPQ